LRNAVENCDRPPKFELAAGDANRAVGLAGMMAKAPGAVCIAAGIARPRFVTELLKLATVPIGWARQEGAFASF
jgi:hypothetical protein